MIWLTWRQARAQAAAVFGGIAVLAVLLAATGSQLARDYQAEGSTFLNRISGVYSMLYLVSALAVLAVPAVIGMFWGAPLVTRELDAGTHRLIWTQTTRTRWLLAKLGLTGLAAMAAAGLLSLAVAWWASPIDQAIAGLDGRPGTGLLIFPRLSQEMFDERGITPLGYAAFAFVLGVTIGVLIRRTLPAMAVMLAVFVVTQVAVAMWVRPNLMTPEHVTTQITTANFMDIDMFNSLTVMLDQPGAWIISQQTIGPAGRPVTPPAWFITCVGAKSDGACFTRLTSQGYRQLVTYQPASRFWALQSEETALYLALAVLLGGACFWLVRERI